MWHQTVDEDRIYQAKQFAKNQKGKGILEICGIMKKLEFPKTAETILSSL